MAQLERSIRFYPAWDKRSDDPAKNYGVHGVEMVWFVKGPGGVVQFKVFTNWMLPHLRPKWDEHVPAFQLLPMAADLGYHSPTPRYEGQSSFKCDHMPGGICYYDGSTLNAEAVLKTLIEKGDEAVWQELESYYHDLFEEE